MQVLLDPFEEQFDLPAALVQTRDGKRRQLEVVGEKHETLLGLCIEVGDATKRNRILLRGLGSTEHDRLAARNPVVLSMDRQTRR